MGNYQQVRHYSRPRELPPVTVELREILLYWASPRETPLFPLNPPGEPTLFPPPLLLLTSARRGGKSPHRGPNSSLQKLPSSERRSVRLRFRQGSCHSGYIDHLYSLFQGYCGSPPRLDNHLLKATGKRYQTIYFQTLSSPILNEFRSIFYDSNGTKIVPHNIGGLLTARGLAYWAMDDGCSHHTGFYLCTDSFAYQEVKLLSLALQSNFGLDCTVQKYHNVHRIYICARSILWSASGLWFGLTSILL
jgi:hypothetical protein